jgi:benzoyl-CoA reductase subunit A
VRCAVGIDLGSTTTKAVLLDEQGVVVGQGITNSRSNYTVACAVAREEATTATRLSLLVRALDGAGADATIVRAIADALPEAFQLALYREQLGELHDQLFKTLATIWPASLRQTLVGPLGDVVRDMENGAEDLFGGPAGRRRSDFFRDLAAAAFMSAAERACADGAAPFERLAGLFDRAILDVETQVRPRPFLDLLGRALSHVRGGLIAGNGNVRVAHLDRAVSRVLDAAGRCEIEEVAFVGTGYGRQTLPFPKECIRSEILCHGRGAHAIFPGTRTVLDIGGQDTKAIQVDESGVVTSFQMNDRCAAGCGRYLGYIADELGLGLHELGPLALRARRVVRVNSTCTVFAGAELRERLAIGQSREDILAGLHRAMMLRAMSLLARSGGVRDEFTFTGGVCRNEMATKVLQELVAEHYGEGVRVNIHPESIYMGARGAAMFALDDVRAGRVGPLPGFVALGRPAEPPPCGRSGPEGRHNGHDL